VNLALPALVILLGLLPGIACFYGYFAGRFDKRIAGLSGVEELALYVIFAIPLNAVALVVCRHFGLSFQFALAMRSLAGSLSDTGIEAARLRFKGLRSRHRGRILPSCSAVMCGERSGAGSSGHVGLTSTFLTSIETLMVLHSARALAAVTEVLAYVDVLTEHPGEAPERSRLFRGLVVDFEISSVGGIDSLTLRDSTRGKGRGSEFEWVSIPSSRLIIVGSTIHSINMTYVAIEEPELRGRARFHQRLRIFARRFFLEEP
jgi:hypothetical protein